MTREELIEELAELEHRQWELWSQNIAGELRNIRRDIDEAADFAGAMRGIDLLLERWRKNWKPYKELDDKVKERDRKWAREALEIMEREANGEEQ